MHSTILTALIGACMLSFSSAAAIVRRQSDYAWDITDLTVSCADSTGCSYLFNISGPEDPEHDTPAFNAQCRAQTGPMDSTYRRCEIGLNDDGGPLPTSVEAYFKLDGTNFYESEISVQMTYPDLSGGSNDVTLTGVDKATYNVYKGESELQVFPTQTSAIA